eukprot:2195438-Rhodomonas_salina.2
MAAFIRQLPYHKARHVAALNLFTVSGCNFVVVVLDRSMPQPPPPSSFIVMRCLWRADLPLRRAIGSGRKRSANGRREVGRRLVRPATARGCLVLGRGVREGVSGRAAWGGGCDGRRGGPCPVRGCVCHHAGGGGSGGRGEAVGIGQKRRSEAVGIGGRGGWDGAGGRVGHAGRRSFRGRGEPVRLESRHFLQVQEQVRNREDASERWRLGRGEDGGGVWHEAFPTQPPSLGCEKQRREQRWMGTREMGRSGVGGPDEGHQCVGGTQTPAAPTKPHAQILA